MRQENHAAHLATRQYIDSSVNGLGRELREESHAAHAETRYQFGVVAESLRHQIETVADGVAMNTEAIARLETKVDIVTTDLDRRVTRLEVTVAHRRG
jgi:CheY-like chemotaxis protein